MESKHILIDGKIGEVELKLVRFSKFNELEYSRLISMISHDISNPVAILKSNIQLLRNNYSNNENELNQELLGMCDESVEELVRFLDNLKLINSSIKSLIKPKFTLFEIKDILYQLLDSDELSLNNKRISVRPNIEVNKVSSDLDFLRQILLNLLTNALKFSRSEVFLDIFSIASNLEIVVQDFGIGIPEDEIEEIFNPFYRGSKVKKTPGMGLGLSVVKALTESLGGQIYLYSLINQGTIIRIVLPNEHPN